MDSTLNITDGLTLYWKFKSDASIDFVVSWSSKSWISIGFMPTVLKLY